MKPDISPQDLSESQLNFIASALYSAASEFYADSANQKAFEAYIIKKQADGKVS